MDVLLIQFLTKSLQLTVFLLHLLRQVLHNLLQLVALDTSLTHLLLQFVDEFFVLLHRRLDELHVLTNTLGTACSLTLLSQRHTALSLCNLAETLLDVAQGGHHVSNLILLLGNDLVERVTLHVGSELCLFHSVSTTGDCQRTHGHKC